MKIIEALKTLPVLEKRILKASNQIAEYASAVDNGNMALPFETEEKQRKEVMRLMQAVRDLVSEKAKLRRQLYVTNSSVTVEIGGMMKTIAEWIEYREKGLNSIIRAYSNMNTSHSDSKVRQGQVHITPETGFKVVRFYDEAYRNGEIERYEEIRDKIDTELEKINATTDLKED